MILAAACIGGLEKGPSLRSKRSCTNEELAAQARKDHVTRLTYFPGILSDDVIVKNVALSEQA